jgi:hypothetical protein
MEELSGGKRSPDAVQIALRVSIPNIGTEYR